MTSFHGRRARMDEPQVVIWVIAIVVIAMLAMGAANRRK